MLSPKIIAIDDDRSHLNALVEGLNELRIANLPIHYKSDNTEEFSSVKHVRIIFSDLHLLGSDEQNQEKHFAIINVLLDELVSVDNGPFVLILWTRYSSQANALKEYLDNRLVARKRPVSVVALNKNRFITAKGDLKENSNLQDELLKATKKNPHVAALIDWESRALEAAGITLATIDGLIADEKRNNKEYAGQLDKLLAQLASGALGRHANGNKLQAINQAISPILLDSLVHLPLTPDRELIWKKVFKDPTSIPNSEVSAELNRMIHISTVNHGATHKDRGVVLKVDWNDTRLKSEFGYVRTEILQHFKLKNDQLDKSETLFFLQIQPACDYANRDHRFLPYVLGVAAKKGSFKKGTPSADVHEFPVMRIDDTPYTFRISANFLTRFSHTKFRRHGVWFRFREEILNDAAFGMSKQIARPGIYSFKG